MACVQNLGWNLMLCFSMYYCTVFLLFCFGWWRYLILYVNKNTTIHSTDRNTFADVLDGNHLSSVALKIFLPYQHSWGVYEESVHTSPISLRENGNTHCPLSVESETSRKRSKPCRWFWWRSLQETGLHADWVSSSSTVWAHPSAQTEFSALPPVSLTLNQPQPL